MGLFSKKQKESTSDVLVEENWPFGAPAGFVVLDFETTGLSPANDRVIEIGMVRTDASGNPLSYWSSLVNPQRAVEAIEIHGISDADVAGAPTFENLFDDIFRRIQGQVLVAHNAKFDMSFLKTEMARTGWELPKTPTICTMQESKNFIPGLTKRNLQTCLSSLGVNQQVQHRALGDAALTTTLLNFYLSKKSNAERSKELLALLNDATRIEWSSEKTFPDIPKSKTTQKHWRKTSTNSQIMEIIKNMMPDDLLGDNPEEIELSYAQTLLEALEDGVISTAEVSALNELASSLNMTTNMQLQIHGKIMRLLAEESWKDGVVSKSEQAEITSTGESLGFSETDSKLFIKEIEELRASTIGANAKKLPDNWDLGEPLLVGDRVVITGCYEVGRTELENQAKALGVKITGAISGKTSMLVSDGTIGGNKDNDAKKLGVRTVSPEVFRELLKFVQPKSVDG